MKRVFTILKKSVASIVLMTATLSANAQSATEAPTETLVIGGIQVNGIDNIDEEVLRAVAYNAFVNSKKYLLNDRFDVAEKLSKDELKSCMGKNCLKTIGEKIDSDKAVAISYDGLGDRIIVSVKMVDVASGRITYNENIQFEFQPSQLNRMTDIAITKSVGQEVNEIALKELGFKNDPALSQKVGKTNNSGPRIGMAYAFGDNADYLTRDERQGGLGYNTPAIMNIGYQFEAQYVGSENFSGLFEFIFNAGGLEKATLIPSLAILNGARFGKGKWEIAVGPSLSFKKLENGVFVDGNWKTKYDLTFEEQELYADSYFKRPDTRGATYFSTNWVVGVGKTFRSGALNIPVNIYGSFNKYGNAFGVSVGLNVDKANRQQSKPRERNTTTIIYK